MCCWHSWNARHTTYIRHTRAALSVGLSPVATESAAHTVRGNIVPRAAVAVARSNTEATLPPHAMSELAFALTPPVERERTLSVDSDVDQALKVASALREFRALQKDGIVSEAEFEEMKKKLLAVGDNKDALGRSPSADALRTVEETNEMDSSRASRLSFADEGGGDLVSNQKDLDAYIAEAGEREDAAMMNTCQVVQGTWQEVLDALGANAPEIAGIILFKHIFRIAPQALSLFPFGKEAGGNVCPELFESAALKKHGAKVVSTVHTAVGLLKNLDKLIPMLAGLGKTHVGYGVEPAHYDVVGEALLATLSDALGEGYTTEVHDAWAAVYDIVKTTVVGKNYDWHDATYEI